MVTTLLGYSWFILLEIFFGSRVKTKGIMKEPRDNDICRNPEP